MIGYKRQEEGLLYPAAACIVPASGPFVVLESNPGPLSKRSFAHTRSYIDRTDGALQAEYFATLEPIPEKVIGTATYAQIRTTIVTHLVRWRSRRSPRIPETNDIEYESFARELGICFSRTTSHRKTSRRYVDLARNA